MKTHLSLAMLATAALLSTSAGAQEVTVFRNVTVIPMNTESVLPAQTVVVRGERIESVGAASAVQIAPGARIIDGSGRYLVPGLAEMHAHVPQTDDQRVVDEVLYLYVANGVTTARGMLGAPAHLTPASARSVAETQRERHLRPKWLDSSRAATRSFESGACPHKA